MHDGIDPRVANAAHLTQLDRANAAAGLTFDTPQPLLLARGTVLCRIGHATVHGRPVPEQCNYASSWWISQFDFGRILALGQREPSWAARVALAIAEQWGGDCRLQMRVVLGEPLYAWHGPGRVISGQPKPRAVAADDAHACWFPDAAICQLYLPGLVRQASGQCTMLWATALTQRQCLPLLLPGHQLHLGSGQPFAKREALVAGRRAGSVQ